MLTVGDVNGIPGISHPGPEPYTAALVVGAGIGHESVRTLGVAHLVEHLVMGAQPRTVLDVNAMVDDATTIFHATGPAEQVADWLTAICRTIRDLPLGRLEVETKVLDAEDSPGGPPALCWSAGARYGATGVGLLGQMGPPHRALTAAHVNDHVRRLFTSGNAVVVATGPLPRRPDLYLPPGPAVPRPAPERTPGTLPAYLAETPHPVVSWVTDRSPAASALTELLVDSLTDDLRHRQGLVYELDHAAVPVDGTSSLVALRGDGEVVNQQAILTAAVERLRHLAEQGPDAADLAHHHAVARARMTDPRGVTDFLFIAAARHLEGRPVLSVAEHVARAEAVTAADVREAARIALASLLLGGSDRVPEGVAGVPDRTDEPLPDCPPVVGRTWKRKLVSVAPLDLRVDADDRAIAVTVMGERHGGRWADLVGVAAGPWFRAVIFRDGTRAVVIGSGLRDAAGLFAEIDRHAGDLRFDVDEEWLAGEDQ
ncbi:MAG: hypothetical protein ACRCYR_04815 [Phycicoccus sp.]